MSGSSTLETEARTSGYGDSLWTGEQNMNDQENLHLLVKLSHSREF